MTPKDKAKELVEKFHPLTYSAVHYHKTSRESIDAISICFMVVDEIINSNPHSNPLNTEVISTMEFWQEVKKELEKL